MKHPVLSSLALILITSAGAWAQTAPQPQATQPQASQRPVKSLNWPKSFGGQPDFEFEKQEVLQEATQEDTRQGKAAPVVPTLGDVAADEITDPMRLSVAATSTTTVSGTLETGMGSDDIPELDTLNTLNLGPGTLPSITTKTAVNLNEFKQSLLQTAQDVVADYSIDPARYTLGALLNNVTLQAVMVSPVKYAVIDNQRYTVGDHFTLHIPMGPTDADLLEALQTKMPKAGAFSADVMEQYQTTYEDVVQQLATLRQKNPEKFTKTITFPVTILDIQNRKVILNLQGQRHELTIRYAY